MAEPKTGEQTRDLPLLSMRGAFSPGGIDEEKRTAEMVWTTGARVKRGGLWTEPYWEELSLDAKHVRMGRLNNGAPLLASHNGQELGAVLGVVESARIEGGQGVAVVRFAKAEDHPEAEKVFRLVKDGILQNVSVGYRVHRLEKTEEDADKCPVMRATDWEPFELSVVPMGADDGAGFRSSDAHRNPCVFVTPGQERQMEKNETQTAPPAALPERPSTIESATRAAAEARMNEAKERAAAEQRAAEAARQAERERVSTIRSLVRRSGLGDELADKFISDDVRVDDVRAVILDHLSGESDGTRTVAHLSVQAGEDRRDKFVRGASAWLFERTGMTDLIEKAQKADPRRFKDVALDGGEFRGLGLIELARESLERQGVRTRGLSRMDLVAQAFTMRSSHSYQTTSDFAVMLENVLFKVLLGQYAVTEDTWTAFCKTETVADFRVSNRYRLGSLSVLDSVNEHGEFKNKTIPDASKIGISAGTKGNIIALSRQTIINDDMGALANVAAMLGRAAKLSIETDVYTLLATNSGLGPTQGDSQPFFHSNRANVNATASAITVAGINADATVMASQKDPSGNEYLDLRPAVLLVPYGLRGDANTINDAQFDPADNKFQKPNYVRGLFQRVVGTPRLTGTRRYLFSDPSIVPAIVVAFLEGQGQAPVLESEQGWRVDGVEWKVRLDYKAQMFDPKGAVTNAGQ